MAESHRDTGDKAESLILASLIAGLLFPIPHVMPPNLILSLDTTWNQAIADPLSRYRQWSQPLMPNTVHGAAVPIQQPEPD